MRRRTPEAVVITALQQLDVAPETGLTTNEQARAAAIFARIVTTPGVSHSASTPPPVNKHWRRWLMAAGVVGAVGVSVPSLLVGGVAYGSWTATPRPLVAADAADAAMTCSAALGIPDHKEPVAIAERRGAWIYVLLAGQGTETMCLMPDDVLGEERPPSDVIFGSHNTDAPDAPQLDAGDLDEGASAQGSTDEGWFVLVEGYVGTNVTGVTVHTSSGREIEASVVGDRFAAWWPAQEQSSSNSGETWSYTAHLADGSSRAFS